MNVKNKKGLSVLEYAILVIIIISAFLVMRNYIQRGIYGVWGKTGQSFAFGRQYDSQKSIDCAFDEQSNLWYDRNCIDSLVNQECTSGNPSCPEAIITNRSCQASSCSHLNN